jgi:hypothetical protein
MDAQPNPREVAESEDDEDPTPQVRNLFCTHYDSCLSAAVRAGWTGWTCAHCELRWASAPPSATRFAHDRHKDD